MPFDNKQLIGLETKEAMKLAQENDFFVRVMRLDGKNCFGTCDLRPERINVAVENGIVKEILGVG